MGWTFINDATRKDVIAKLIATDTNSDGTRWETLAHCTRGNVLWAVVEVTDAEQSRRYIVCHLLDRGRGDGWGYKSLSEADGPFYYSCPPAYLDMVPVAREDWRRLVRAYHRPFRIGERVKLVGSSIDEVQIASVRPLVGIHEGKRYRVPKKLISLESRAV